MGSGMQQLTCESNVYLALLCSIGERKFAWDEKIFQNENPEKSNVSVVMP